MLPGKATAMPTGSTSQPAPFTVFGIRHHGPGSAFSLRQALEALQPDALLVEGPPEASELIQWVAHPDMQPPVALLIYPPDQPHRAAFYPFAVFSPEWQALCYGAAHGIPTRFIDLPLAARFAGQEAAERAAAEQALGQAEIEPLTQAPEGAASDEIGTAAAPIAARLDGASATPEQQVPDENDPPDGPSLLLDPLGWAAHLAGEGDGEAWWERQVEQRRDTRDLFAAVGELMQALRQEVAALQAAGQATQEADGRDDRQPFPVPPPAQLVEADWTENEQREAAMRQAIRQAIKDGYRRIAVVCGAWHAPALGELPPTSQDARLLKGRPRLKVAATWTPWSYGRLSLSSGYGAGIHSPGWYHHLWASRLAGDSPEEVTTGWMTRVAHLLRGEDLEASSASTIEAVRLAEALAALRGRTVPGLEELNDAAQSVFCSGDSLPLRLVREKLIVGECLGQTPAQVPQTPLQADLAQIQRRLRLAPEAGQRDLDLDLRQATDRERSILLHRLDLLDIPWGQAQRAAGKSGTFHELWRLEWQPEFAVRLVEASLWGNTVATAAGAFASHLAGQIDQLPALTRLLERALPADLPEAIAFLMQQLENRAALSSDTGQLLEALPPLANVLRYGDVRRTDTSLLRRVLDGLVARILIGLPLACASLNDDAALEMYHRLLAAHQAINLLQIPEYLSGWQAVLLTLAGQNSLHGLLAGRCCRLLLDQGFLYPEEAARRLGLAISPANQPAQAAAWVEGFLRDSGAILIHDRRLWQVMDDWVTGLPGEAFTPLLPLLRRTFGTFLPAERRQLGQRLSETPAAAASPSGVEAFDLHQASRVLPVLRQIFGIPNDPTG